jgi:transglutaminase-like putative cysteine protease
MRWLAGCLALALVSFAADAHAAPRQYSVAPEPAWIEHQATVAPAAGAERGPASDLLLWDSQLYVGRGVHRRYQRSTVQLRSSAALDDMSHLHVSFRPFERVTLHTLQVIRKGQAHDRLKSSTIDVVHNEPELSSDLLTGTSTIVIVVDDLRVGDVLDWSFSVDGANPVLRDHLSEGFALAARKRIHRLHGRLVVADDRRIQLRSYQTAALAPPEQRRGSLREYSWVREDVPAYVTEDELPYGADPEPWLQVSDFDSWNAVARWASEIFAAEPAPSAELAQQLERWRKLPTEKARIEAALTFTRQSVRYFGMELGDNSHEPHPPSQVFAQRFGDCKDKAQLLVAMLRALGVQAWPALTNTKDRSGLDQFLPSFQFNHAIVAVQIDGQRRWLDPTDAWQRGPIEDQPAPPFERALIVDPATTALAEIAPLPASAPGTRIDEHYWVDGDGSVRFDVTTTLRGTDAADFRARGESTAALAKAWLSYYSNAHPALQQVSPPTIEEAADGHVVTVEHYRTVASALLAAHDRCAESIMHLVAAPNITRRTLPLAVHFPTMIEQHVRIDVPAVQVSLEHVTFEDGALWFHREGHVEGESSVLDFSAHTLRSSVAVEDVQRHLALMDDIRTALYFRLEHAPLRGRADGIDYWVGLGLLGVIALGFGIYFAGGRIRGRLRRRRIRRRTEHASGETAATALDVSDEAALEGALRRLRCACDAAFAAPSARETVHFGGRALVVVRLDCPACSKSRRVYFDLRRMAV